MALENGKIVATGTDLVKMTYRLARSMKKKDTQFITVISGCDVSDEDAEKRPIWCTPSAAAVSRSATSAAASPCTTT